jgi:biotin synthase-like enzyme
MDRDDKLRRGDAAKRLMGEPLLNEAFAKLEAGYVKLWIESGVQQVKDDCHRMVKVVRAVKRHLELEIQTGELTAEQIQIEEDKKRGLVAQMFRRA